MKTVGTNPGILIGDREKARRRALIMAGRKPPLTNAQRQKAWRERQRPANKTARQIAELVYENLIQNPEQLWMVAENILKFLDMVLDRGPEDRQIELPLD